MEKLIRTRKDITMLLSLINKTKSMSYVIATLLLCNFIVADPTDGCELSENEIFLTSDGEVLYNIPADIAGIQFTIDGTTASGASGGEAGAAGFTLTAGGSTVLGFSFSGATVSTDCGLLLSLTLDGAATGLSNMVFADSAAQNILVTYYEGEEEIYGCTNPNNCAYNPDATVNDGSCATTLDSGSTCDDGTVGCDCYGLCGGGNYYSGTGCGCIGPEAGNDGDNEWCWDCNATANGTAVEDCAGVCDGSSVEDDCGVCEGDNESMDCAGVCDGDAVLDNCDVCDNDSSNDDVSCTGCTNLDADNHSPGSTIDDGSCDFSTRSNCFNCYRWCWKSNFKLDCSS